MRHNLSRALDTTSTYMPLPDSPAKAAAAAILLEAREACGLRVAIIGAGFGGLALARALHEAGVGARVYEQDESLNHVLVGGELRVPSAERTLAALGLEAEWWALRATATQPDCLPLQGLKDVLAMSLSDGQLECGRRIVSLTTTCAGELRLEFADGATAAADLAVVASGMAAPRVSRDALRHTAAIGDARWAQRQWWDLGARRIREGADMALVEGLELGELLVRELQPGHGSHAPLDLGIFAASRRRWPGGGRRATEPQACLSRALLALAAAVAASVLIAWRPSLVWELGPTAQTKWACGAGQRNADASECLAAVMAASSGAANGHIKLVDTPLVPPGCSYSHVSGAALFNSGAGHLSSEEEDYQLACTPSTKPS